MLICGNNRISFNKQEEKPSTGNDKQQKPLLVKIRRMTPNAICFLSTKLWGKIKHVQYFIIITIMADSLIKIISKSCLMIQLYLTGEGELSQRDVTVQTVINETDADALGLHLHPWQRSWVAAGAGVTPGSAMARHVLSVLQQPCGSLVQLTWGMHCSVLIQVFIK